MPVEFLTDEQAAAYGSFQEVPNRPELERFFFFLLLDDGDRDLIALRRSDGHRLGLALQICTVRYVGLFLEDPLDVPWPVVEYLAGQLGIADPSCVKAYIDRVKTAYEHSWEIRKRFGYHEFEDRGVGSEVPLVPLRAGVDPSGRTGRVVQPRGGVAAPQPGAAARGQCVGPPSRRSPRRRRTPVAHHSDQGGIAKVS